MFGYVRPAAERLPESERDRFRSVYCGLCHTLGKRYGFAARFVLNYDFALLAVLLSLRSAPQSQCRRCIAHPCQGCAAAEETPALDAAADHSLILAWWQLRDHIADHGFLTGLVYRIAALFLRCAYSAARKRLPDFDEAVRRHLEELAAREREKCASLDEAADPFASLLAEIADTESDPVQRRVLRQLFYHLGRWIYLVDAADDLRADTACGGYNPLIYRFGAINGRLSDEDKRLLGETLDASIRQMAGAWALLDGGVWTGVLDSIFYDSLYGIGKAVLDGKKPRSAGSAVKSKDKEETK